jgi:hypothetical protein
MKSILLVITLVMITSCGYSVRDSDLIGQVKKVSNETPLLCEDRTDTDISLGVMRNGVGSMSTEDIWLTVPNKEDKETLIKANETGSLVKITYDSKRVTFCWHNKIVKKVEIVK